MNHVNDGVALTVLIVFFVAVTGARLRGRPLAPGRGA